MWPFKIKIFKTKCTTKDRKKNKISSLQLLEYRKIQVFSKIQALRYGYFRRSDLKKEKIKKIVSNINPFLKNINSSDPLIISIKGLTKFFVGEMIEICKQLMYEKKDSEEWVENPIQTSLALNCIKSFSLSKL
mmetsp:Transcript_4797/g.11548  ORF Transcript_4797/g.11548 Transcript_4797/m.11548 type:complete len:133 (+) Transcript_4797:900-1298(+)